MIVPKPPRNLEGHCSVIHDNTLYTFSADGLFSIPLERNGTWSELSKGEPVSDAACVKGAVEGNNNQQALYVVGGSNAKGDGPGLQRYSFQDQKWKTLDHAQPYISQKMSNRTSHKAVYLKSSSSLFIYGGQPDGQPIGSSDTFVINTAKPYNLLSFSSSTPANIPILLPWNDRQAALVGGQVNATKIQLFDPDNGWQTSKASLANELPDVVQCAIVQGSDQSKVLEAFDMSTAPNVVTSIALLNPGGKAARPGKLVGQSSPSRKRKRDLTMKDFPTYDDSNASSSTRQQYSLAQGDNGLVVISGGGGTDSLTIFNQTSNSWVNATKLFYGDKTQQEILGSLTSSSPTATSTGSSETSAPADSGSSDNNTGTIIGATLGSILGFGALLLVILFFIKRKKDSRMRSGQDIDKDRLSFQDQGVEPLTQSAYPMAKSPAPLASSSVDSLAIFSGQMGEEKSPRSAGGLPAYAHKQYPKPSPLSTIQSSRDAASTPGGFDKAIEAQDSLPRSRPGDRRTDEGWGKYFQDNDATSLVGMDPEPPTANRSEARTSVWPTTNLTPLNFAFLEQPTPLGRVLSGSPTTEHTSSPKDGRHIAIPESQTARISSADSVSLASDDGDDAHKRSWIGRPPSSTYSRTYFNRSSQNLSYAANPSMPDFPRHDPTRASTNTRGSSVLIPDTLEHHEPLPNRNPNNINSDMSWLNLNSER
ncbi:hypothetical protein FE257_001676 [Aspergillus nanangensis]|uniref:Pre-mRNA splicing factor CLF1 n=1 Tax=Aspergillus nanangensis TaxID=2582783 RepID=A0AAD4CU73_ASPNN|nr:hypothetical protein FE257_001676 [Aspergillus nanangensis]